MDFMHMVTSFIFAAIAYNLLKIAVRWLRRFSRFREKCDIEFKEQVIDKKVQELGGNLSNESVISFTEFIKCAEIVNRPQNYDRLRASYELVKFNKNIDKGIKENLKIALLSRGVFVR